MIIYPVKHVYFRRTVVDKTTGQKVVLSEKDCEIIKRFRQGKYIDSKFDPYEVSQAYSIDDGFRKLKLI